LTIAEQNRAETPLPSSDWGRRDGAFMEPSGRNQWQPLANAIGIEGSEAWLYGVVDLNKHRL
jgi:hypothetical protein